MGDVLVWLRGHHTQHTTTAGTGGYDFSPIPEGVCEIEPEKLDSVPAAISAYDAAYILQSVSGARALDGFQQQACDVTGDGRLDERDVNAILEMTVGIDRRFPASVACGSDWLFAPRGMSEATREVLAPDIDGTCQRGRIVWNPLNASVVEQDFDARLIGDCTGSWPAVVAAGGGALSPEEPMIASASAGHIRRGRGSTVQVPLFVRADRAYYSLESEIAYDPAHLQPSGVRLRPVSRDATVSYHLVSPGRLRIALASGTAIERQAAGVLTIDFTTDRRPASVDSVRLVTLKVDEQAIDVSAPLQAHARRR